MVAASMYSETKLMGLLGLSDELDDVLGRLKRITEGVKKSKGKAKEGEKTKIKADKSEASDGKGKLFFCKKIRNGARVQKKKGHVMQD